ncbi:MAG: hypothetical protein ABIH89_06960 [Elusimicrobiota bacterium]
MSILINKKLFSYLLSLTLIVFFLVFTVIQFYETGTGRVSLLTSDSLEFSKTVSIFFEVTRRISKGPDQSSVPPKQADKEKKKTDFSNLMLYLIASLIVSGDIGIAAALVLSAAVLFRIVFLAIGDRMVFTPPGMKSYSRQRLRFLTPVEKCIKGRANEYDTDHVCIYGRGLSSRVTDPALWNIIVRDFFIYIP